MYLEKCLPIYSKFEIGRSIFWSHETYCFIHVKEHFKVVALEKACGSKGWLSLFCIVRNRGVIINFMLQRAHCLTLAVLLIIYLFFIFSARWWGRRGWLSNIEGRRCIGCEWTRREGGESGCGGGCAQGSSRPSSSQDWSSQTRKNCPSLQRKVSPSPLTYFHSFSNGPLHGLSDLRRK